MGNWGTSIKDSDVFSDIYNDFFKRYNDGANPKSISKIVLERNSDMLQIDKEKHDLWFALALAQWETKSLESDVLSKVEKIIKSGADLKLWKELNATGQDLKKREIALSKFLDKIHSNRKRAKPRKKPKYRTPIFSTGDCLIFKLCNGNYGGAIVIATDSNPQTAYNLVATTRINEKIKPDVLDFEKAEVLIKNYANWENEPDIVWCAPDLFKKNYLKVFECIGKIVVNIDYDVNDFSRGKSLFRPMYTSGWKMKINADQQFQFEIKNSKPKRIITVAKLIRKKKWWQL